MTDAIIRFCVISTLCELIRYSLPAIVTSGQCSVLDLEGTDAEVAAMDAKVMAGAHIDLDGVQYTLVTNAAEENADKNMLTLSSIMNKEL